MTKKILIPIGIIALTICLFWIFKEGTTYKPPKDIESRKQHWQEVLNTIPLGSNKNQILKWAMANQIKLEKFPLASSKKMEANVEQIPIDFGFICTETDIIIDISLDTHNNLIDKKISEVEACM